MILCFCGGEANNKSLSRTESRWKNVNFIKKKMQIARYFLTQRVFDVSNFSSISLSPRLREKTRRKQLSVDLEI